MRYSSLLAMLLPAPSMPIATAVDFDTACRKSQLAKYLQADNTSQQTINYSPKRTPYGTASGDAICNGGGTCGAVFKADNAVNCTLLHQISNLHQRHRVMAPPARVPAVIIELRGAPVL